VEDLVQSAIRYQALKMVVIETLNPQTPIPDVQSYSTIINGGVEFIDLNEDSWATEYFVVFFHTGPQDPVATSILRSVDKKNDTGPDQLTCKVVGISMDTTSSLLDWINSNEDLKNFDVPLMSDKNSDICRQFGVLQQGAGQDDTGAGYPANSVFIIDSMDRVRYHCVLDSRVAFNVAEIARLVRAFQETDGGEGLAMANWNKKEDTVINKISHIKHYYGTNYGVSKHVCKDCPKEEDGSKDKIVAEESYKTNSSGEAFTKATKVFTKETVDQDNNDKLNEGIMSGLVGRMKKFWAGDKEGNDTA